MSPFYPTHPEFACSPASSSGVFVEVDGKDHVTEKGIQHDHARDEFLTELGYEILKISGYDVLRDPREVSRKIVAAVETRRKP